MQAIDGFFQLIGSNHYQEEINPKGTPQLHHLSANSYFHCIGTAYWMHVSAEV